MVIKSMKLMLRKKETESEAQNQVESKQISYTDLPLDYLRDEYPEIYNQVARKYKAVDSYIYIRNI